MAKFGSFLGFKPVVVAEQPALPAPSLEPEKNEPEKNELELDQDLFFPLAAQLGEENEAVRNLLIDAEHKISELDTIKRSIGRLVDPVSKTLRAFEETKSEKLTLQGALNSTRIAAAKLREELAASEKKALTLEADASRLRELLTAAQQNLASLESAKAEQAVEIRKSRAHLTELQRQVQQQATDLQIARSEGQRASERATAAERRMVLLESEASTAQQKFLLAEKERLAVQALLDKSLSDVAQLSRRLLDTENALALAQTRLQHAEAGLAEAQAERARLAAALDEMSERHRNEMASQTARLESLEARSVLSDQLLDDARRTLIARADENGSLERRLAEATLTRDALETRFGQIEIALADREEQLRHLEQARATLSEQNSTLVRAVQSCEGAYNRAQEQLAGKDSLIELLENQLRAATEAAELQAADLTAQLQRERLDRTMAEGALEAGRKDIARLLREIAATKLRPSADASPEAAAPAEPPAAAPAPTGQETLQDAA